MPPAPKSRRSLTFLTSPGSAIVAVTPAARSRSWHRQARPPQGVTSASACSTACFGRSASAWATARRQLRQRAIRLSRRSSGDGCFAGLCLPPSRVAASKWPRMFGGLQDPARAAGDARPHAKDRLACVIRARRRIAARDVVAWRHEHRRRLRARGRRFPPRACSRTASRLAISPECSGERRGAKPLRAALLIAEAQLTRGHAETPICVGTATDGGEIRRASFSGEAATSQDRRVAADLVR